MAEPALALPVLLPSRLDGSRPLFVLRLADGSTIWVVLQAKLSLGVNGSLTRPFLRRAMRFVTPSNVFFDWVSWPKILFAV